MSKSINIPERIAWEDAFNQPTIDQLREPLKPDYRETFDKTRNAIMEIEGLEEGVAWYGGTWKWVTEYRSELSNDPMALVVAHPEDVMLCMLIEPEFADKLPITRLKRTTRDGLEIALEPYETRWAEWSLTGPIVFDEVINLIARKMKFLKGK